MQERLQNLPPVPQSKDLLSVTAASPAMSSTREESSGRGCAGLFWGGDEPSWHSIPAPVILHSWERLPGSCTTDTSQQLQAFSPKHILPPSPSSGLFLPASSTFFFKMTL